MKNLFFMAILFSLFLTNVYTQTDSNDVYVKAIEKIDNKEYVEAIDLLRSIEYTESHLVYYNIGYCYYFLENDEIAQNYLKKSLELNNNHVESYGYLGMSYFFTNQLDESEQAFLRCIELRNDNYKDYYFLGKIYELRNNTNDAMTYYIEALKYNEIDFHTNYSLANIYFNNDDYNNARKYFEKCDEIDNQLYPVVSCLIRIKYKQNDLESIEELKERLRVIRQRSNDDNLVRLSRFTIDTFNYNDFHIFVEESFDLSGDLYYHWVFRICDKNDNLIKTVNLESSSVLRELGTNYIIGMDQYKDDRRVHQTTNIGFRQLPEYTIMKNIVIEEIEKGLDVGTTGIYPYN
jgi:tetratricopeptide (TPR) repeat protein